MSLTSRRCREPLVIGLVNNMGDAALQSTERQFRDLLLAASGDHEVQLRVFSFPELIRGDEGRAYVAEHYDPIDALWNGDLDGLIVTGAEPRTPTLPQEKYWPSFKRLVDWACDSATPTVWSCLAAHAAVLYLDGIERRKLPQKISGVFRCRKVTDHAFVGTLPASWRLPHSRLNTLDPEPLVAAGYDIASLSDEAGVDVFTLQRRALFVFCQGHPEYDTGTLFREYRRDVGRYLTGTTERYPALPHGYFNRDVSRALNTFRERTARQRTPDLLDHFPEDRPPQPANVWRDVAVQLYSNWISNVAERKSSPIGSGALSTAR